MINLPFNLKDALRSLNIPIVALLFCTYFLFYSSHLVGSATMKYWPKVFKYSFGAISFSSSFKVLSFSRYFGYSYTPWTLSGSDLIWNLMTQALVFHHFKLPFIPLWFHLPNNVTSKQYALGMSHCIDQVILLRTAAKRKGFRVEPCGRPIMILKSSGFPRMS